MRSLCTTLLLAFCICARAEVRFDEKSGFKFATAEEGRAVLTKKDEFIERLSAFDRWSRMKTEKAPNEEDFLKFVGTNVVEFSKAETDRVNKALESLKPKLQPLKLPLPETILIIKTTGKEEANTPYTRANAIILPAEQVIEGGTNKLDEVVAHELFHIMSRNAPALREKLYGLIGFHRCAEIKLPDMIQRITNPDAPRFDHYIVVQAKDQEVKGIPIIFSRFPFYDAAKGGEFFDYLRFKLFVVQVDDKGNVSFNPEKPQFVETRNLKSFHDQIGYNTDYVLHPEEILASNFVLLVNDVKDVKTPELLAKIRDTLQKN